MGLMLNDGYGWDERSAVGVWALFGALTLLFNLSLPSMMTCLNKSQLVSILYPFIIILPVFAVHFLDLHTAVSVPMLLVGIIGIAVGAMPYSIGLAVLAEKIPSHLQVAYSSFAQMLGQAGRAFGPVIATTVYDTSMKAIPGSGPNAAWAFLIVCQIVTVGAQLCGFSTLYGSFSDLSIIQKKSLEENKKAML